MRTWNGDLAMRCLLGERVRSLFSKGTNTPLVETRE